MANNPKDIVPVDTSDASDTYNFLAYIEGIGRKGVDPLSPEAMKIQAQYVSELPQHPMDILRRLMVNPFCSPNERINAAKTLMSYSMRAIPNNLEVTGKDGGAIKIDSSSLSNLSDTELETLQTLLAKAAPTEV
jgi:hypothetical protein